MSDARIRITTSGLKAAQRGFRSLDGQARRLGGTLASIGGSLGVAFGAKAVLDFDQKLGRLQADAGLTTGKMKALRAQILSLNSQFAVGKDEMTGALQVFQDFGGNLKAGIKILPELTKASKASGTAMADMSTIAAAMVNAGQGPREVMKQLAQLQNQADAGNISLREISTIIPEVFGIGGAKGQTLTGLTSLLQTVGTVIPDAKLARTQVLALMRDITKKENLPKLKRLGISPFEVDPKTGKEVLKDVGDLMTQILKKTKGRISGKRGLGALFTEESQGALAALSKSFNLETGKFGGAFAKMQKVTQEGPADIFNIKLERMSKGIDAEGEKLRKSIAQFEEVFQTLGKRLMVSIGEDPGLALKRAVAGAAALKFGPALLGKLFAKRGKGLEALGEAAGPKGTPVFVTNMGEGGLGDGKGTGTGAGVAGTGAKGKGIFKGRSKLGKLGAAAGILGAGATGFAIGRVLDEQLQLSEGISNFAVGIKRFGAERRGAEHARGVGRESLRRQAAALAGLGQRGVTTFGAVGKQQALTQENVLNALRIQAEKQGVTADEFTKLLPQLMATLKDLKVNVNIKTPGIDSPKVVQSQGPAQ
jgi:hypothetical protein